MMMPMNPEQSPSMPDTAAWLAELRDAIAGQVALLNELDDMATRQQELVRNGSADGLMSLLAKRQDVLEAFTRLQERVNALAASIEPHRDALAAEDRTKIRSQLEAIGTRLDRIMARDARDEAELRARQAAASSELQGVNAAKAAHKAYAGPQRRVTRYADRKG